MLVSIFNLLSELSLSLGCMIGILNLSEVAVGSRQHTESAWGTFSDNTFSLPAVVNHYFRKCPMQPSFEPLHYCGGKNKMIFFWYHLFYLYEAICVYLCYCRFFHLYCTLWKLVFNKCYPYLGYTSVLMLFLCYWNVKLSAWFVNAFFWHAFSLMFSSWLSLYIFPSIFL